MAEYKPPIIYRNGHANTIAAATFLRKAYALRVSHNLREHSESLILSLENNVQLQGLLTTHKDTSQTSNSFSGQKPLVMILHGWLGCADSLYLLPIASKLHDLGFNIFRLNFRDHGGTQHLNEDLFHSCRLDEALNATQAIQQQIPHSNFYIVGFSLGGNFALRIGSKAQDKNLTIDKIISICPVMNATNALDETNSMLKIYTEYYLQRWKNMLKVKHKLFPDNYDLATINKQRSLTNMTEHLLLKYTEFNSVKSYLEGYSITGDYLNSLSVDSDVYIAEDDPVIPSNDWENLHASEYLNIHRTQFGGHCGYLNGLFNMNWIDEQVIKNLQT
ncbi:MAG: alpha/beta fold hydrolase [Gammaproteobacteria bacterium]|nr:MAG: alpha/beta fold hydrolase [Gammaproteobacteria bacterium]